MTERTPSTADATGAKDAATPVVVVVPPLANAVSVVVPAAGTLASARAGAGVPRSSPLTRSLNAALARALPLAGYYLTRIGPAGVAGVTAAVAAAVLGLTALISGRTATDALTAEISRAQHQHSDVQRTDREIGKLVAALPTREQMPTVIGTIFQQAKDSGVALDNGRYAFTAARAGGTARYDLDFPIKADYPSVRQFINRTLTAVPAAGLEKLRIERKAVGDTQVSADVRFVVFVRSE